MTRFSTSGLCDEPARFVAKLQALASAAPHRSDADRETSEVGRTATPRRLSVEQLCARYENDDVHAEHVTRLALKLFDATHRWLGMSRDDRGLLEAASRLHDVAYRVDPVHHPERGAEIAWCEGVKGFSSDERACIAAIILLCAGKWKTVSRHPIVKSLREPRQAMQLGVYLRIAEGLDWAHVQDAAIVGVKRSSRQIRVRVRSDWFPANLARADQKADLWREVFPLDIRFVREKSRHPRPMVEPGMPALEAARRMLSVQYKTILADVEGAIMGEDIEPLHRIRVAIRRLRCLLRTFRRFLPNTDRIDEVLGSLGNALGPARDLDVWVSFLRSEEVSLVVPDTPRWRALVRHQQQVRRLQLPTVRRELRGARFPALRRGMATLLRAQLPSLLGAGLAVRLEQFAAKKFRKELRHVRELGSLRRSSSPKKLHRLRVALRRARYLGEFFGPVLGNSADKLTRRLHRVEKPLAAMHDLDVGLALLRQSGPAAPRAFVDLVATRREAQRSRIEPAWQQLVKLQKKARRELRAARPAMRGGSTV